MMMVPYLMCTQAECEDRVQFGEVSAFECTDDTIVGPIMKRKIDPTRAVSKYRRSAAGSVNQHYPLRNMEQLTATVAYLLEIIAERRPPQNRSSSMIERGRESLLATVAFVEDRLRAVQVDLIKLQQPSQSLQVRIARCQILILFLTADCPTYERRFGETALETALSTYWHHSEKAGEERKHDDEILAYTCLYHLTQALLATSREAPVATGTLSSHIHRLLRKHCHSQEKLISLSMMQWSLEVAVQVLLGHWHISLRRLQETDSLSTSLNKEFVIMARCLLAPGLSLMRRRAIEAYQVSFRKGEAVSATDLSHLLQFVSTNNAEAAAIPPMAEVQHLSSATRAALDFGQALNLPIDENCNVLFKVQPLRPPSVAFPVRDDAFVLGSHAIDSTTKTEDDTAMPSPDWVRAVLQIR